MSIPLVVDIERQWVDRPTVLGTSTCWAGRLADGRKVRVLHTNPWLTVQAEGGECLLFAKHDEPDMTLFGMMQATSKVLDWSEMKGEA